MRSACCSATWTRPRTRHPDLVASTCTVWCRPIGRSSPPCTAPSAPAGPSCSCRATSAVELPLQTLTHLDADGTAVFPHTVLIAAEGSDVTFIDRFTSP